MPPGQMAGAIPPARHQYQPAQWQPNQRMPSPAYLASGAYDKQPITARGVAAIASPAAIQKFVLPSPQTLGVSTSLSMPAPKSASAPVVDWRQIQTRMERLGVLRYNKVQTETGGVEVMMLFPTSDLAKGQPMSAQADTEAAAVVMILNYAEDWARKR